jgi:aspartyl-tRNA(Asn)/glutamyl-tRNA(Gln) amidotransferase subunit A
MDHPLLATHSDFSDPTALGIAELAPAIRSGALSPVALTEACLARIARYDNALRCFVTVTADRARLAAARAEAEIKAGHYRGPLHGIPYALKDIVDVAGVPTTAHSRLMPGTPAAADAHVTTLLEQAGAILLGKLGTFEFALGGPSWDLPWPPPLNPWNTDFLPGGSSSGSGAAVAARFVPMAIGTDTGGSVRWPAACCGIVGLKPTYGLLSRRGVQPNTFSIDHCGPMTRTVRDCALMLNVCAGHDPRDPGSADEAVPDYVAALTGDIAGLRIALVRNWYAGEATSEITDGVDRAAAILSRLGAIVEEVSLPDIGDYCDCKTLISTSELFTIHAADLRTRPEAFGEKLRQRVLGGVFIRAEEYLGALRWRNDLARGLQAWFGRYDALVTAGWLTTAEPADPNHVDFFRRGRNITMPFSLAGVPAISVPIGFGEHNLPLAMQIAAAPFAEATVLRVGDAYERVSEWTTRAPILHSGDSA